MKSDNALKELAVVDMQGKKVDEIKLPKMLSATSVSKGLLHAAVKMYENNSKTKLASTKTRGVVSGTGKKPWKQKGTGRARVGEARNPLWKGGGKVFGPVPRDSHYQLNHRMKRQALTHALVDKIINEKILTVEKISLAEPKTKLLAALLKTLKVNEKSLLLLPATDEQILRAGANLPHLKIMRAQDVTAYDVLCTRRIILTKAALENLIERLK